MKKYNLLFLLIPILCGCSYLRAKIPTNPPTQDEQFCLDLKRNIIFNTASAPTFSTASPTQQAKMMRLYDERGCAQLLDR